MPVIWNCGPSTRWDVPDHSRNTVLEQRHSRGDAEFAEWKAVLFDPMGRTVTLDIYAGHGYRVQVYVYRPRGNSSSVVEDGNDLPGIADRDLTTNTDMF